MLNGCAGNDHAVELLVSHQLEVTIEGLQVLDGRILARVGLHLHEMDVQLQGSVGQETDEVRLRCNLQRHQVEYDNPERTDILAVGTFVAQHEDILVLQEVYGRKPIGES